MKRLSRPGSQAYLGFRCSVVLLCCLFITAATCLTADAVFAQAPSSDFRGRIITEIQVRGNSRIATSTILAKISSKPGQPYQDQTVNQDVKSLQQLRGIRTVYTSVSDTAQKFVLIFQVFEESVVGSIEFVGNRHFPDDELYELLPFKAGSSADTYLVDRGSRALLDHHRKAGYDRASVTAEASQTKLVYRIVEVPDSTFTYTWEYAKDNAGNDGDDAAYLDQVIFQPTQYTLTVNTSSAGVISRNLDQPTYDAHFVVVLEAVPEPGFTFQSWTTDIPDINLTDNPLSFPMEDNYTITANWSGIASYDTWKSIRFEGQPFPQDGDNEDPDGNGIANLLEYALGFSPQTPISNLAGNNLLPIFSIENNQSQLTFNRLKGAADINYIVEVSEDLFQWQSGSGITQVISVVDQGGTDAVTVADQTNVNILNKRFMRLNIQRQ